MVGTTLLLVRHGHTAGNDAGREVVMSGWTDIPLSPLGLKQAQAAAELLSAGPAPVAVYSSDLQRARETASCVAGVWRLPVISSEGLREIHCGEADGLPRWLVEQQFRRHWARNFAQDDDTFRWPGGESHAEFRARVVDALRGIADSHPGQRVVVVTHAGVVSQLLGSISGVRPACWAQNRPRNGSVTEVQWSLEGPTLIAFDRIQQDAPAP